MARIPNPRTILALFAVGALVAGCGSDPPAADCPTGARATQDGCRVVCQSQADCLSTERCDPTGVCVPLSDPRPDGGAGDAGSPPDAAPFDAGAEAASISSTGLDFGALVAGERVTRVLDVTNGTGSPVIVRPGAISGAAGGDYTMRASVAGDAITLAPGGAVTLSFELVATALGDRRAAFAIDLCEGGCAAVVDLVGRGIEHPISCEPASVDFGSVSPVSCGRRSVRCTNVTSHGASLEKIALDPAGSPDFRLDRTIAPPISLAPLGATDIPVELCPSAIGPRRNQLDIEARTPSTTLRQAIKIDLSGVGGGPDIRCEPTSVELGDVAVGMTAEETVLCRNRGNAALSISQVAFAAASPMTAALTLATSRNGASVAVPVSIAAGEALEITVRFAPTSGGSVSTEITVSSNDPDSPAVSIPVSANGVAMSGCSLALEPPRIDFGAVQPGLFGAAVAVIRNAGRAACSVTVGPVSGQGFSLLPSGSSETVTLMPGDRVGVPVIFGPAAIQPYSGSLSVMLNEPGQAPLSIALEGRGAGGGLALEPSPAFDFGQVPIGCRDPAVRMLALINLEPAPVMVTQVAIAPGSSPSFSVRGPTSFTIPAGGRVEVPISFQPTVEGDALGRVRIEITTAGGAADFYGLFFGEGTTTAETVVSEPPSAPTKVDVLFVIDDHASMGGAQILLSDASFMLIDAAREAGFDAHFGVISTDSDASSIGRLRGSPRFVSSASPNAAEALGDNLLVGTMGSSAPRGLEAATRAVADPQIVNGHNASFLRSDGRLVVIVLSDAEDQSALDVTELLMMMRRRSVGQIGTLEVYTLSGGPMGCNTTAGDAAAPSERYPRATRLTGGFDRSICAGDYTPFVSEMAGLIFPLRAEFQLGSRPMPGTVRVDVNGRAIPQTDGMGTVRWGVDYLRSKVIFTADFAPGFDDRIDVRFEARCVPMTCGDGQTQPPEQCDDANPDETDACSSSCLRAFCGDAYVRATGGALGEVCDDGNTIVGDGCNHLCHMERCGNSVREPPEQCDLGGNNSDVTPDACRTDCRLHFCGDQVIDSNERCDDGNQSSSDECVEGCVPATCGDGFVHVGVEQCDDGNRVDEDTCDNACTWNVRAYGVSITPRSPLIPTPGGQDLTFSELDDGVARVSIGFPFSFPGTGGAVTFSEVFVSTNGLLAFVAEGVESSTNQSLPDNTPPDALIAWWWDDLDLSRTSVLNPMNARTNLIGSAPNRVRTFTFLNVRGFTRPNETILDAEVRLHESGVIEVHYGVARTPLGGTPSRFSATVGWEAESSLVGQDVLSCSPSCDRGDYLENTVVRLTP